jgi:hypothetical protein
MIAEAGQFGVAGQNARLIHTIISRAVSKNWWLISLYIAITIAGVAVSYFLSGWVSVAVTAAVAIVTFLVGLRMMHQVVTITNEVR